MLQINDHAIVRKIYLIASQPLRQTVVKQAAVMRNMRRHEFRGFRDCPDRAQSLDSLRYRPLTHVNDRFMARCAVGTVKQRQAQRRSRQRPDGLLGKGSCVMPVEHRLAGARNPKQKGSRNMRGRQRQDLRAVARLNRYEWLQRQMEICGDLGRIRIALMQCFHNVVIAVNMELSRLTTGDKNLVAVLKLRASTLILMGTS